MSVECCVEITVCLLSWDCCVSVECCVEIAVRLLF